jgi:hypothetical protein
MTSEQQHYLEKRLRHIGWWNRLGWLFLVLLAGFYGWLWKNTPLYIDPMLLLNKLRIGQVSDIEIAKLAALGNLAFIGCGILLAGIILLTYAAVWTEKQTIKILTQVPPVALDPQPTESIDQDESKT